VISGSWKYSLPAAAPALKARIVAAMMLVAAASGIWFTAANGYAGVRSPFLEYAHFSAHDDKTGFPGTTLTAR
jgi:hypothetical protein